MYKDVRRNICPSQNTHRQRACYMFPEYPHQNSYEYKFDVESGYSVLHTLRVACFDILNVYFENSLCLEQFLLQIDLKSFHASLCSGRNYNKNTFFSCHFRVNRNAFGESFFLDVVWKKQTST